MTHRLRAIALATLLALPQIAAAQTPAPAPKPDCEPGGKIATTAAFEDGSSVRVLDRTGDVLRYESITPKGPTITLAVKNGFFTQSAELSSGTNTFAWVGDIASKEPLKEGDKLAATGTVKGPGGQEAVIATEVAIGAKETLEVEGCPYPTVKATVVNTVAGKKSMVVRYYHEKSMLTLKTVVFVLPAVGDPHEVANFRATTLK